MSRFKLIVTITFAVCLLAGCGQKGDLVKPTPKPAPKFVMHDHVD